MKLPKLKYTTGQEAKELRRKLRMNQSEFWSRLGTTQSGGSRYESGRDLPEAVRVLLNMTYGPDVHAQKIVEALRDKKKGMR